MCWKVECYKVVIMWSFILQIFKFLINKQLLVISFNHFLLRSNNLHSQMATLMTDQPYFPGSPAEILEAPWLMQPLSHPNWHQTVHWRWWFKSFCNPRKRAMVNVKVTLDVKDDVKPFQCWLWTLLWCYFIFSSN